MAEYDSVHQRAATLTGPITAGCIIEPLTAARLDLAALGYVEEEFFAAGTASAFEATSAPTDGRWTVIPTASAAYRTRIIVRRPADRARCNGTVVAEWMNQSSGESAPDWGYLNPELTRRGYVYVAVSAQALAVVGGTPLLGSVVSGGGDGLVNRDPTRYGELHHPGDQYAYDIFAQVGSALRKAENASVMGGAIPRHVVAVGESQSAFYLTTYADIHQPDSDAYDGLFIHSRGGVGMPLDGSSVRSPTAPAGLQVRTDLDVPVFIFETQTDVVELGYGRARQPNTNRIRTWEVAGTAHADSHVVGAAAPLLGCTTPINDGPQHAVVQAAFSAFITWVTDGTPPPTPDPFALSSLDPVTLALDEHGNVIGGVRTPAVDVPVSTLSGSAPPGASALCALFGSTEPFSDSTLLDLYDDKETYLARFAASLDGAIEAGYVLDVDRDELLEEARLRPFPS